jgi:hypothetical protein
MIDNRGIDTDPGWVNRKLHELQDQINALRSERRAAATEVTDGDFTISGGGSVRVRDGGGMEVEDGGSLRATYPNDATAAYFGGLFTTGSSTPWGRGLLVVASDGHSAFWVGEKTDGSFEFIAGTTEHPASVIDLRASGQALMRGETGAVIQAGAAGQVQIGLGSAGCFLGHGTTSSAANAYIDANGFFARVISSRRHKDEIRDANIDPLAVLQLRGRTWRDKPRADDADNPTRGRRHIGFIAEELHDLGLTAFVTYDQAGRPDAIQYDRLSVALLAALKWLRDQTKTVRDRVEALEAQVATQQQQLDDLAAQLAAHIAANPTT